MIRYVHFVNYQKQYIMKNIYPLITLILLWHSLPLHAQVDTRGTEFWLSFGSNSVITVSNVDLQIRIASGSQHLVTGSIYFYALNDSVPFSIPPNQVYTHILNLTQRQAAYNTTTGTSNRSVRITTSAPVSVYALNQYHATTEATHILPVKTLSTEYYHISYIPYAPGDAYVVVATQNNTSVRHNNAVIATLNMGQVYYRLGGIGDMTGAHITTDKPIAFFAATAGALIPEWERAAVDCLFEQMSPINTWGKTYFTPVNYLGTDMVRIVASQNNTTITQIGGKDRRNVTIDAPATFNLNAGQFYELRVPSFSNGCYIQADKPVGVCTYMLSSTANLPAIGDPSQAWVPPLDQAVHLALMAPFIPKGQSNINRHQALIVTPTATKDNTIVQIGNGAEQQLSGGIWHDNAAAGMSYYTMPLTFQDSTYLFINMEGLIVWGVGIGNVESYYYLASSGMRSLIFPAFYANDIPNENLASTVFCTQFIEFCAKIEGDMSTIQGHLKWYIDDVEEVGARDRLSWSKTLANGRYKITLVALSMDEETVKTVESFITIEGAELDYPKNIVLCAGETVNQISFTGSNVDASTCNWEVTSGSGTAIGMKANSGTGVIPSFIAVNIGTSNITVAVTVTPITSGGCEGEPKTFTIKVDAKIPLEVNLGNDTMICRLDSLLLNAEHPNADSYYWHNASTKTTYTVYREEGKFWVIIEAHCNKVKDSINIDFLTNLHLNLGKDLAFCEGDVIYRTLNATTYGASSYLWQDGSISPMYVIADTGIYRVTVSNACISVSDSIKVGIKDCGILEMWIPNAFTPNGDGINDIFKSEINDSEYLVEYEMAIYSRFGNLIFITQDYLTGWNGKDHKGKDCSEGVYTAIFRYKDYKGKYFIKQASVTLLR